MDIIPVIDLKGGDVVRARGGERHLYAPIVTQLASTSRPRDVIAGFRALSPFRRIYIADLDAISGAGGHAAIIAQLEAEFPEVEFWVDCGLATEQAVSAWCASHRGAPVIGSESLGQLADAPSLENDRRRILSLDFRGDVFLGPHELAENPALWPQRIIVMTLARVGANEGPDFMHLASLQSRSRGHHDFYAAGGVRGADDLHQLAARGIRGALVASALHDRRITAADLSK